MVANNVVYIFLSKKNRVTHSGLKSRLVECYAANCVPNKNRFVDCILSENTSNQRNVLLVSYWKFAKLFGTFCLIS